MSMESFNACVYLVDRQVQACLGGQLAVTGPAGSLTYAELAARAAELAAGFQAVGVRPEERVLLVATDRPETVITFCALLRMGAIPVPVSTMYRAEELGELVADSRARVVVATPECAAVARAAMHLAPEAATLVTIGDAGGPDGDGPGEVSERAWTDVLAAGQAAGPPAPGQSVDAGELIAFCKDGLATFKRPRQVLALDALPKTATGKIQRVVVREVVARQLGKPGE